MRAAFFGTPVAAVPSLAALADVADVELVVTRPDARRGRTREKTPPAVKAAAIAWGFPVLQPLDHDAMLRTLAPLRLDIAVVVAFGWILRPELLAATRLGFLNVHFSLLPRWRGAAPVERAILAGDASTGVSLMQIDAGLDTGPVIAVIETPIADDETGGSLTARLSHLGAQLIDDALPGYAAGGIQPAPQMEAGASRAHPLTVAEARIDATVDADTAARMVRAFTPRPGAWLMADGQRLKVWKAAVSPTPITPNRIEIVGGIPAAGLSRGSLELLAVQVPGKAVMSGIDWANGRRGRPATMEPA
jgi:methionyl-tRNA formyltransferase